MNITNIRCESSDKNIDIVSSLLKSGIHSDFLFDNFPITMTVKLENPEEWSGYFYRKLWEIVYIHQDKTTIATDVELRITLSEAIGYIRTVTPPVLQSSIPKTLVSVDEIIKTLEMFLTETDSPEYKHYMSVFQKHIHFEQFSTIWNIGEYDDRIKFIRYSQNSGGERNSELVGCIMFSDCPLNQLVCKSSDDTAAINVCVKMMCVFHARTNKEKRSLADLLETYNFKIDNVRCDAVSIYVTAYSENVKVSQPYSDQPSENMITFLRSSYRAILND